MRVNITSASLIVEGSDRNADNGGLGDRCGENIRNASEDDERAPQEQLIFEHGRSPVTERDKRKTTVRTGLGRERNGAGGRECGRD